MRKILFIVICLFLFSISCSADINPSVNLNCTPDYLDFGYTSMYSKTAQSIILENTGGYKLTLKYIYLDFTDTTTTDSEMKIKSGEIQDDLVLNSKETHEVNIEFRPMSQGLKEAKLIVKFNVGYVQYTKIMTISGQGYTGFINLQPAILKFESLISEETESQTITVTNNDSKTLTINSIEISNLSTNTQINEFTIVEGWNDDSILLDSEQSHAIKVKFKPASTGVKSAKLIVRIAESTFNFNTTLQGFCYEPLKFTVASPLPDAIRGTAYNCPITCEGGDGNYTIETSNSSLPDGLSIQSLSIVGTPELEGNYTFALRVSDDFGQTAKKNFNLHVSYATLVRDTGDADQEYNFKPGINTGLYTFNLIAKGDLPLDITSIELTGDGVTSGEAKITSKPATPLTLNPGNKIQIIIDVVSLVDKGRDFTLTVKHSGYNSPFIKHLWWSVHSDPNKHVFVLQRSGSMASSYNRATVYDLNGNIIPYPSKWQAVCSFVKDQIMALPYDCKFDIITFNSHTYNCFSTLKEVSTKNINSALGWLFSQSPGGGNMAYNPLSAAFNNYGEITNVYFYTDGCFGDSNSLLHALPTWINSAIAKNPVFKLDAYQIGGSPMSVMVTIGSFPNTTVYFK